MFFIRRQPQRPGTEFLKLKKSVLLPFHFHFFFELIELRGFVIVTTGHVTAVAVQTNLFENGRTFVQCCSVFMPSIFVSYCTLHSTNCTQFRKFTQNQCYLKFDENLYCAVQYFCTAYL